MPKAKAITSLSGLIDSELDDPSDVDMMLTPDSNQENAKPTKTAAGKTKAVAVKSKRGKPASRRLSAGKPKVAAKKKASTKRAPLKEQDNEQQLDGAEDTDDLVDGILSADEQNNPDACLADKEEKAVKAMKQPVRKGRQTKGKQPEIEAEQVEQNIELAEQPKKSGRQAKAKQPAKKVAPEPPKVIVQDGEFEYTPTTARQGKLGSKAVASKKAAGAFFERVIAETQAEPTPADESALSDLNDELEDVPPESVYRQVNHARANSTQRLPQVVRRRAGSASDTERAGSDPATRRKLGEMTKKFENLELKYKNLREIGVKEAEANFERLKSQSEERTKAANDLIASLKKELATQKFLASTAQSLRSSLAATETQLSDAQSRVTQLTTSLTEAQNENKSLSAKLAAARAENKNVESTSSYAKTPGSVIKGKGAATRTIMVGSAEAAQAAQVAQLKEELYADLTGLLLRGVDRMEEADVYDCIQTGRNGTLHFKLAIATDSSATSYEETQFEFTPRLDKNRDRELLRVLPEYLTEEIAFSRQHAAKFYSRIVDSMTRVPEDTRED